MKKVFVINAKGEKEPFSFKKVYFSARRAGASDEIAFRIAKKIEVEVFDGISTKEIFKKVKRELRKISPRVALSFNLKEGIRRLGPSGYPFEKFVAGIFRAQGYKVRVNVHLKGKCCVYEIDFVAKNEKVIYIGECKYHHVAGEKVDLKVALSNYARFLDLKDSILEKESHQIRPILVTNTKFTKDAISYSECVGTELLGWRYPKDKGLEKLIEERKLYPITILPSLKSSLAKYLIGWGVALIEDLKKLDIKEFSKKTGFSKRELEYLLKEAQLLF